MANINGINITNELPLASQIAKVINNNTSQSANDSSVFIQNLPEPYTIAKTTLLKNKDDEIQKEMKKAYFKNIKSFTNPNIAGKNNTNDNDLNSNANVDLNTDLNNSLNNNSNNDPNDNQFFNPNVDNSNNNPVDDPNNKPNN